MKTQRHLLLAGALALLGLAGCASESYVSADSYPRHYHSHYYGDRYSYYHEGYAGRPPGPQVEIYVQPRPRPVHPYRW